MKPLKLLRVQLMMMFLIAIFSSLAIWAGSIRSEMSRGVEAGKVFLLKDATADILPPPMFLVEVRLLASQLVEGSVTPKEGEQILSRLTRSYEDRVQYWRGLGSFDLNAHLLGEQHDLAQKVLKSVERDVLAQMMIGDFASAGKGLSKTDELFKAHLAAVQRTVDIAAASADKGVAAFAEHGESSLWFGLAMLGATVVILICSFGFIGRSIWRAVGAEPAALAKLAGEIADGNLTRTIRANSANSVAASLEQMRQRLRSLVDLTNNAAREVVSAASEISSGNSDLSERTQSLANNVQEFRISMESLTQSIVGQSKLAGTAHQLSDSAAGSAISGVRSVDEVIERMGAIDATSKKITEIVTMINGIAFQTNILSLNAAVEAARAGEQGRGFAVVAAEVRELAARSAKASQDITALMKESAESVAFGSGKVQAAGVTMQEIVSQFDKVNGCISDITETSARQSDEVSLLMEQITALDDTNQQNAALVEQAAAASESLMEQSRQLAEAVGTFRV